MVSLEKQKEHRRFPRICFPSEIRYQVRGKTDFDNALSKDISDGGLRLTGSRFIPTSSLVMLEISVLNRILRPVGRVAWSMPLAYFERNQIGLEFIEFDTLDKNYLHDFINMQL